MPDRFDDATLAALTRLEEVELETTSLDGARTHRTIIWVVTDADEVFVRSVRGLAGRWYREVRRDPAAILHLAGAGISVRAELADDAQTVKRVSDALSAKYGRRSPQSTASMLQADTLATTLRLDPNA